MKNKITKEKGFSLLELVVIAAIISIIASVFLISHNKFKGNVLITNVAYDVALSIREAQSYGISVREYDTGQQKTFGLRYGVHFDDGSDNKFVLFADVDGNGFFTGNTSNSCSQNSECDKLLEIKGGNKIKSFCGISGLGIRDCYEFGVSKPTDSPVPIKVLDILFQRPEPDACIRSDRSKAIVFTDRCLPNATYGSVEIAVVSAFGAQKKIIVSQTGQISIK